MKHLGYAIGLIGSVCHPAIAAAQQAGNPPETATESDDSGALTDIVVTAQRRTETLQKASVSVAAVTGDEIATSGTTNAQALTQLVPSLQIAQFGGPYLVMSVRGLGNFVGNALGDSAVAFNYDDVPLTRPSSSAGFFYDLERIEILRGPQGTLYGRNATGGVVRVLPAQPKLGDTSGSLVGQVGNFSHIQANGHVNLAIGEHAALRISGQSVDRDGIYSDGLGDQKDRAVRAQLLFAPSADLRIRLAGDYFHQGGRGPGSHPIIAGTDPYLGITDPVAGAALRAIASPTPPGAVAQLYPVAIGPRPTTRNYVALPTDLFLNNRFGGVNATIEWTSPIGTLTIIPAWRAYSLDFRSVQNGFLTDQTEDGDTKSIEVRLASNGTGSLQYVVGAFHQSESVVSDPTYDQQFNVTTRHMELDNTNTGVFADAKLALLPEFRIGGGIRYSRDRKKAVGTSIGQAAFSPTNPTLNGYRPNPITLNGDATFSRTTWRALVEYDVAERSLLYGSVATGYKGGGFFFSPTRPRFEPESVTAYTIGSKNRFFDNRLQINLELFHWKYKDQQVSHLGIVDPATGATAPLTENAGSATLKGFDLEAKLSVGSNTQIGAEVEYVDAVYDSLIYTQPAPPNVGCPVTGASPAFTVNCSGKTLPQSPKWTVIASIDHRVPFANGGELRFNLKSRYESERLSTVNYVEPAIGSNHRTDFRVGYHAPGDEWFVDAYVNNIENDAVPAINATSVARSLFLNILREPRTYGIRFGYNF